MLYSMKEVCQRTGLNYETLKFYCNQGLVPNVKRDGGNRRVFDERDLAWLEGLGCLRRCGLSIKEMQHYVQLCLRGRRPSRSARSFWPSGARRWRRRWPGCKARWNIWTANRPSTTRCWQGADPM